MKKKNTGIIVPLLWTFTTGTWIATVCVNISRGETQGFLFVLQCACVFVSAAAALANFIRYKRSINSEDKQQ